MKKIHIVTTSTCHIPPALCQELEIHVVPLPFVWDGRSYLDDEISPREFYSKLRSSRTIPTTSGPTPGAFKEKFETLGADGNPVLAILVGSVFSSSTSNAATLAKENSPDVDVTLFDSRSNTLGHGFQVLAAARAAKEGKGFDEVLALLKQVRKTSGVIFATPDIHYLRRGGRINHIQRFFAAALNLVPIMEIRGGPIEPVERVRSQGRVIPHLLRLVAERLGHDRPVRIGVVHADAEAQAWDLAKAVRERFQPDELFTRELTPVLGIHAGPDAIGIAYSHGF